MQRTALVLLFSVTSMMLGCGDDSGGDDGAGGTTASGGAATGGATASGGAPATGGATGSGGSGVGGTASGGAPGAGGTGGTAAGGMGGSDASGGTSAGGSAGAGAGPGSGGGTSDCTPAPEGTFMRDGDVVHDPKTCLTWMQASVTGQGFDDAETYCDGLELGGYDDWRLPTASEVASIVTNCGSYPPIDTTVFTIAGDGIWTTTPSETTAGDRQKLCGIGQNTGQYYDFGPVGAQNTRCVRGQGSVEPVADCNTAQGCTNW